MAQFKSVLKALFLAFMVLSLAACRPEEPEEPEGRLVIGVSAEYPPFEFKQNNEVVGFDIDLGTALAQKLNRPVAIQNMDFAALIPAVQSGRIDLAISSLSATPERAQAVDFSAPYYESHLALMSQSQKPIHHFKDMPGQTIGVQMGSTMEQYLKTHLDPALKITVTTLNSNLPLIEELKIGRISAVLVEDAQAYQFVKNNPSLIYDLGDTTGLGYAIALKKDSALTAQINATLKVLKEDGTLKALEKKWLENNHK